MLRGDAPCRLRPLLFQAQSLPPAAGGELRPAAGDLEARLPRRREPTERTGRSFDAWFAYVEEHPAASKMLFREPSGNREAEAVHAEVSARSRAEVMKLLVVQPGAEEVAGSLSDEGPGWSCGAYSAMNSH